MLITLLLCVTVLTVSGADLSASNYPTTSAPVAQKELVTFIVRGQGFVAGGTQNFNTIAQRLTGGYGGNSGHGSNTGADGNTGSNTGYGSNTGFLAPTVFIGDIPLQVVQLSSASRQQHVMCSL